MSITLKNNLLEIKGSWSGLGTDTPIFHREEPKKRVSRSAQAAVDNALNARIKEATVLWDNATADARLQFAREYLDGFDKKDRTELSNLSFKDLRDRLDDESFIETVKNITHSGISFFTDDF